MDKFGNSSQAPTVWKNIVDGLAESGNDVTRQQAERKLKSTLAACSKYRCKVPSQPTRSGSGYQEEEPPPPLYHLGMQLFGWMTQYGGSGKGEERKRRGERE
jgi:hypothetical protein